MESRQITLDLQQIVVDYDDSDSLFKDEDGNVDVWDAFEEQIVCWEKPYKLTEVTPVFDEHGIFKSWKETVSDYWLQPPAAK